MRVGRKIAWPTALFVLCMTYACQKRVTVTPVSTEAQSARVAGPVITFFEAEPTTIAAGQLCYLHWATKDATTIGISKDMGPLGPEGQRAVSPTSTTTYTLSAAKGPRTASASVTVTVIRPLPYAAIAEERMETHLNEFPAGLGDIHFDNEGGIVQQDRGAIQAAAIQLKSLFARAPDSSNIALEGHCDQISSAEYALAVADHRAWMVKDALVRNGVPPEKLQVVSYGQEQSLCQTEDAACAAQNRRVHISRVP